MNKITFIFLLGLLTLSCVDVKTDANQCGEMVRLQAVNDSLKQQLTKDNTMEQRILPSLTFQKNEAEQAMEFYVDIFDNSKVIAVERWGKEGPGKEGTIMQATFELNGQRFLCSDSPPIHNWDFTPAVSNFVVCNNTEEIEELFSKLSEKGEVAMPLDDYGFSKKFAWVIDRFGVSWQLNLE